MTSPFLERAAISIKSAKLLLDAGDTDGACSRAYYAMYDAARACLAWACIAPERGEFKTHHGLIAAFGLHLVKHGLFPEDKSKSFQRVQVTRQIADYDVTPVPHEKAAEAVLAAESFVATAAAMVADPYQRPTETSS
jgi:uncharacterized protein (UPF0332 family)